MGFPLKNLSFIGYEKAFYLQKQLDKNSSSYYYADLVPLLEELPYKTEDESIIRFSGAARRKEPGLYFQKTV
jgi:hypothetical protein